MQESSKPSPSVSLSSPRRPAPRTPAIAGHADRKSARWVPAVLLLSGFSLILLVPGLYLGPSRDPAVFASVAKSMLDGLRPYVGVWDHKPPVTYLVLAAGQLLVPWSADPWLGSWLMAVAVTVGAGVGTLVLARRMGLSPLLALIAGILMVLASAQYAIAEGGGFSEQVAALFAVWSMVAASATHRRRLLHGAAGVLAGLAMSSSPLYASAAIASFVLALSLSRGRERWWSAAAYAAGAAGVALAIGSWLALRGSWSAALNEILTYNLAYRASELNVASQSLTTLLSVGLLWLFLLAPATLGLLTRRNWLPRPSLGRLIADAAILWLLAGVALLLLQGLPYAHYLIGFTIPLALFAASGLKQAWAMRAAGRRSISGVVLVVGTVCLTVSLVSGGIGGAKLAAAASARQERRAAVSRVIDQITPPESSMFVWGNESWLYAVAGRRPASRYVYLYPLTTPGYSSPSEIDGLLAQLMADPPCVIVDAGSPGPGEPGVLPLLIPRPLASEGRNLDLLDPIRQFVGQHYVLVSLADGWPVYQLSPASDKCKVVTTAG